MTTGDKIRAARKKAGLTQRKLGELCGIAEPTIRKYELGKLNPKKETLEKIAEPLGVYYATLYGDDKGDEITSYIMAGMKMGANIQIADQKEAFLAELSHEGYEFTETERQCVFLFNHLNENTRQRLLVDLLRLALNPEYRKETTEDTDTPPPPDAPEGE